MTMAKRPRNDKLTEEQELKLVLDCQQLFYDLEPTPLEKTQADIRHIVAEIARIQQLSINEAFTNLEDLLIHKNSRR